MQKLTADAIGALNLISVYLGDRLGLYRVLAEQQGATPAELASSADLHPRYVREWLEQQTVSGILETENPEADDDDDDDDERRYRLPRGHDEANLDDSSLHFMAALAQAVVSCTAPLEALLDAFRTGAGIPYPGLRHRREREPGPQHSRSLRATAHQRVASPGALRARLCCESLAGPQLSERAGRLLIR